MEVPINPDIGFKRHIIFQCIQKSICFVDVIYSEVEDADEVEPPVVQPKMKVYGKLSL